MIMVVDEEVKEEFVALDQDSRELIPISQKGDASKIIAVKDRPRDQSSKNNTTTLAAATAGR